MVVATGSGM